MFVISLTYTAPVEDVDRHLDDHVAWLRQAMADGILLAAGRKVPRDGGMLFAIGPDRAAVEAFARTDPFVAQGVADIAVTEVQMSMVAQGLDALKQ